MQGTIRKDIKRKNCRFCFLSDEEKIIIETDNFYIIPSVGSIVEGYLLLNTKFHIPAMASINKALVGELLQLKKRIRTILMDVYKTGCIFYEHGRAGSSIKFRGTEEICFHA